MVFSRFRQLPPLSRWPSIGIGVLLRNIPAENRYIAQLLNAAKKLPGLAGACAGFALLHNSLSAGKQPTLRELQPTVSRLLKSADKQLGKGRETLAVYLFDLALQISFHPAVHYGESLSPFSLQTDAFLRPYRESALGKLMFTHPDPITPARKTTPGDFLGRPRRALVLSHDSWTFIDRVVSEMSQDGTYEFRRFCVADLPSGERPSHRAIAQMRFTASRHNILQPVPESLAKYLDWADTVVIEWATYPLAWFSLLDTDRFNVRVVARMHRYEMFTPYPLLMRFSVIDQFCFVAPGVQSFVAATAPRLEQCLHVVTVPNVHDFYDFKVAGENTPTRDQFALIQIKWANEVKDVEFTLETLRLLRKEDSRYHLVLVGDDLPDKPAPADKDRVERLRKQLSDLGDCVTRLGFRRDIPSLLASAGFIISSSRTEGTHESVAEGAATGCIPVVRNWPEMAPWGGAALLYPREWIVESPDEAAQRILSADWPKDSVSARDWLLTKRNPEKIIRAWRDLLG
ncbi:glycosyltransferase [Dermabacteraceae bacterium P7006]